LLRTHFLGVTFGLGRRPKAGAANRCTPWVFVIFVSFVFAFEGCGSTRSESQPIVAVTRQVGSWQGHGSTTVGDVNSETGRLRIIWQTTNESPAGTGHFKLTLRSGVSGRTIAIVADHRGVGAGTLDTDEGPRTYDFLVDSANVDWSFRVEETSGERPR
jgi:hypothetical protein